MKKVFFSLLMASVVMMSFQSCKKDKKDEPKAKLPNEISGVITTDESLAGASVYAITDGGEVAIAQSKITGKKFSLKLNNPADKDLVEIKMKDGINVSDKNAKSESLEGLYVAKKGNKEKLTIVGRILCSDTNPATKDIKEKNTIEFIYVDRPVKISGTYKEPYTNGREFVYNFDLKKGWNLINQHVIFKNNKSVKIEGTSLSSIPSNYKWYLELQEND